MNVNRVLVGWLGLVVMYTLVERNTASKVSTGLNGFSAVVARLSDPTVALIPNNSKAPPPATPASPQNSAVTTAPGITVIPNATSNQSSGTVNA